MIKPICPQTGPINTAKNYVMNLIKGLQPMPGTNDMYTVYLDPAMLSIDTDYQTDWRQARKSKLTKETWDFHLYTPIKCNLREDGTFVVFDGAHRCKAALDCGYHELQAHICIGLSKREEVRLFIEQDIMPIKLSPREKWLARRSINDPRVIYLDNVMMQYNFRIKDKYERGNYHPINAIERILKHTDSFATDEEAYSFADCFFGVLGISNWGIYEGAATKKEIVDGIMEVFLLHNPKGNIATAMRRLIKVFSAQSPDSLAIAGNDVFKDISNQEQRTKKIILGIADDTVEIMQAIAKLNLDKIGEDVDNIVNVA